MSIAEKLTTIADNEQKVYDKGKSDNLKKIWDIIQSNGKRNTYGHYNYSNAFQYQEWDEETFRPTYDIILKENTQRLFLYCDFKGSLKKALDNAGVKLDTSACTTLQMCFYGMYNVTELPQLDLRNATNNTSQLIHMCQKLKKVDGIICSENTKFASDTFGTSIGALQDCIFSGVIGKNIWLSNLTGLNKESIMSVINCLKDFGLVYSNDSTNWINFGEGLWLNGYKLTVNAEITEGKEYTVRIKDNGYGDEDETREFDFKCDLANMVQLNYADGFLEAKFVANETLSGEFDVGVLTNSSSADLGSIEIRQTPTTTRTLTLGTTLQDKLEESDIAIATQKGWTIA